MRLYSIASTRYGDDGDGRTVSLCVRRATVTDPATGKEDPAKEVRAAYRHVRLVKGFRLLAVLSIAAALGVRHTDLNSVLSCFVVEAGTSCFSAAQPRHDRLAYVELVVNSSLTTGCFQTSCGCGLWSSAVD